MRRGLRYSRSMPGAEAPIQIVDTAMAETARIDPQGLESRLPNELERTTGARGQTMVAFALVTAL
jgi:hypothetical protein